MNKVCRLIVAVCIAAAAALPVHAQTPTAMDEIVVTHQSVSIGGKALRYSVRTGLLPLYDNDTGELMARMFIMAYTVDQPPERPARPLTFLWNGGPGSSSSQVHLMGFGPKGFRTPDTYPQWTSSPAEIADRPDTWLQASDLVFVDPIGTGYSRATSEKFRDILYTTHGDAEAVAEVIRLYRTRFDAWDAPLFIAGESYGTARAMRVAEALERRRTHLAGVVLISGGYQAGQQVAAPLRTALQVPMYTATAHFHKRLPPELQSLAGEEAVRRATAWARDEYAPALDKRDALSDEQRAAVLEKLAWYTGLKPRLVDFDTLSVDQPRFLDELLADRGLELGRYDSRMSAPRRASGANWEVGKDPSIRPMLDLMQGTSVPALRYIRNTLQYRSDLLYRGPFGEAFHPLPLKPNKEGYNDDWMAVLWDRGAADAALAQEFAGESPEMPPLRHAMTLNPGLLVFNVKGMYDGSCAALDEAVRSSPPEIRSRVRNGCYAAGHMLYTDVAVRRDLLRDFTQFVRDAIQARAPVAR